MRLQEAHILRAESPPVNGDSRIPHEMKWLKTIALVLAACVVLLALVPFFISVSAYIPAIEKEISARLEEPVSIDDLKLALLPAPHLTIEGIAIGSAQDVKIAKLSLKPDLLSLVRANKVIRSVEADDLVVTQQALVAIFALARRDSGGGGAVRVEQIRLDKIVVKLERGSFGPLDVRVQVSGGERPGDIQLRTRDDAFEAHLTPEGEHYVLEITARDWTPPLGPAVRFDELKVKGVATSKQADLNDIAAKIYGGTASGKATIGWEKGVTLKGSLAVTRVEMKPLAALFSREARLSGRLDAKPVFTAHAQKADQLDDTLRLETPFTVHDGVLHGVDIAQAAASVLRQGSTGGETRFDKLGGRLLMERGSYRFTQLDISSGLLAARGNVTIAPNKSLSGELNANVAGIGRAIAVPLTVAGTVESPMVYPNASALAGAALGTAVLGPGIGTAAGAKLGGIVEGILGRKKK